MGANFIIASDVSNRGESTKQPINIFEVLQSSFNIMQDRGALPKSDECDCYIRPDVIKYSCWGFGDGDKIFEEGKRAAIASLPKLKRLR